MNPETLAALMASDTPHAVLDLRERGAYQRGHIYRSTLLPRRELELRLPALVPSPAVPIVLVDEDGALAALAGPTLAAMGYRDVRALEGGLAAWRAAGRPLVQGVNVFSKVFGEQALHHWKTPEIAPKDLADRIARRDDMVIVDSRTPEEYHRACVPGAISVPGGELVFRILDLVKSPEQTIVVHCGGRTRSYIGAESLRRMGLPNPIVALKNGTMGWDLAGLTLERGASRGTPAVSPRSRAAAALVAKRVAAEDNVRFVTPDELKNLLARRAERAVYVLDVRTRTIVLACDGFARATLTAAWLKRMGFPDVAALAGGVPAWTESGGVVETGHPSPAPFGYEAARAAVPRVKPGDLGDALVLDVDTSDAYARGHVPGAAWICRSRLEATIGAVPS